MNRPIIIPLFHPSIPHELENELLKLIKSLQRKHKQEEWEDHFEADQ